MYSMKPLFGALVVALVCSQSRAEEAIMKGGVSPGGRYEVKIVKNPLAQDDPNYTADYGIQLYAAKKAAPIFKVKSICGYRSYAGAVENCVALWHASGKFFVVQDMTARHCWEIHVVAIVDGKASELTLPDYVRKALAQVKATEVDFALNPTPLRWDGDDLIVELYFTAQLPEGGRAGYTTEVTLHLDDGPDRKPSVRVAKVGVPRVGDG